MKICVIRGLKKAIQNPKYAIEAKFLVYSGFITMLRRHLFFEPLGERFVIHLRRDLAVADRREEPVGGVVPQRPVGFELPLVKKLVGR